LPEIGRGLPAPLTFVLHPTKPTGSPHEGNIRTKYDSEEMDRPRHLTTLPSHRSSLLPTQSYPCLDRPYPLQFSHIHPEPTAINIEIVLPERGAGNGLDGIGPV
jgi:hypothetical protein